MTEFLYDGGWISNAGLLIIVIGYTIIGIGFGFAWGELGYEKRERRRIAKNEAWHRSYSAHPSNQR